MNSVTRRNLIMTKHVCKTCGKKFTRKDSLKRHSVKHTSTTPAHEKYICEICGKEYARQDNLTRHAKKHTGTEPVHKCPHCPKIFGQSSSLKIHIRTHTGERPFACPFCQKSFKTRSYLNVHIDFHKGAKPYLCDVCGKAFTTSGSLSNHSAIHTGQKLFGCSACDNRYAQRIGAWKHIKKDHPDVNAKVTTIQTSERLGNGGTVDCTTHRFEGTGIEVSKVTSDQATVYVRTERGPCGELVTVSQSEQPPVTTFNLQSPLDILAGVALADAGLTGDNFED